MYSDKRIDLTEFIKDVCDVKKKSICRFTYVEIKRR